MKKLLFLLLLLTVLSMVLGGCTTNDEKSPNTTVPDENIDDNIGGIDQTDDTDNENREELSLYLFDGIKMVSLRELSEKYDLTWHYDSFEGTIKIKNKTDEFSLLKETSILAKNGIYLPNESTPYIDSSEMVYLPTEMLKHFNLDYLASEADDSIVVFNQEPTALDNSAAYTAFEQEFPTMGVEEIYNQLAFLASPIEGAHLPSKDSQLPGAPRTYRNGTHEGIDWYADYVGVHVDRNTPILSMAEGVVVRADHDYVELSEADRSTDLNTSTSSEHTPEYILDKLRGRTVWVQYKNGVTVRYAHMDSINENIRVGDVVKQGDILGYVGNSGTSYGVEGSDLGLHLHSDILIYNHLFWENLNQEEIKVVLERLFPIE